MTWILTTGSSHRRQAGSGWRQAVRALELCALCSLGVAYPLFQVLTASPEFFVARNTTLPILIGATLAFCLALPLLIALLELLASVVDARASTALHYAVLCVLVATHHDAVDQTHRGARQPPLNRCGLSRSGGVREPPSTLGRSAYVRALAGAGRRAGPCPVHLEPGRVRRRGTDTRRRSSRPTSSQRRQSCSSCSTSFPSTPLLDDRYAVDAVRYPAIRGVGWGLVLVSEHPYGPCADRAGRSSDSVRSVSEPASRSDRAVLPQQSLHVVGRRLRDDVLRNVCPAVSGRRVHPRYSCAKGECQRVAFRLCDCVPARSLTDRASAEEPSRRSSAIGRASRHRAVAGGNGSVCRTKLATPKNSPLFSRWSPSSTVSLPRSDPRKIGGSIFYTYSCRTHRSSTCPRATAIAVRPLWG